MQTPLLKWPGGKTRVYTEIQKYVPPQYSTYYEPFLGGASTFLNLNPVNAVISDNNPELINLYRQVAENLDELVNELKTGKYVNNKETYNQVRSWDRNPETYNQLPATVKAARTLYLNKTCFNGLYRVNSHNQFNTPYGYYQNPTIVNETVLNQVHRKLSQPGVRLKHASYEQVLDTIRGTKNFVYLDPPYVPLTRTSSFTAYTKDSFGLKEQEKLAEYATNLDKAGNYMLLSNSDTPTTRELYKNFLLHPLQVTRSISAGKESRGKAPELLIVGPVLANLFESD